MRGFQVGLATGDSAPECHVAYTAPDGDPCTRSGQLWVFECPNSGQRWAAPVPCGRLDCGTCYQRVKARRGDALVRRMGADGIGALVFTFPAPLHPYIGWRSVRNLRRMVADTVKRWADEIFGARVGFYVAFHPEGDSAPGRWKPHFHVAFSLRTEHRVVRGFRTPLELGRLKSMWAEHLTELATVAGVLDSCETDPAGVVIPHVNYKYRTPDELAQLIKRVRYDARPFPDWSADTIKFDGNGEQLIEKGMPVGVAQPVSYGLLSPRSKADVWRAQVAMELSAPPEDDEPKTLTCRCCSSPQVLVFLAVEHSGHVEVSGFIHPETGDNLYPDTG